ncbi:HipA domain-containing protein [Sphingomonas sp. Leaf4]|uniref:HipA domain-containing protein n=1 Tax=Sphingomonas sp. Leaf4 TaxID=2876553 RepID=UPI001E65A14D|nr:HipA domain-containing protein [Sphingomonas sp. Leaf4]
MSLIRYGRTLVLTPAYDLCPQPRSGDEASQAMLIVGQRSDSRPVAALAAALPFLLSEAAARAVIDAPCGEAALPLVEREILRTRAFLNPYAFEGYA